MKKAKKDGNAIEQGNIQAKWTSEWNKAKDKFVKTDDISIEDAKNTANELLDTKPEQIPQGSIQEIQNKVKKLWDTQVSESTTIDNIKEIRQRFEKNKKSLQKLYTEQDFNTSLGKAYTTILTNSLEGSASWISTLLQDINEFEALEDTRFKNALKPTLQTFITQQLTQQDIPQTETKEAETLHAKVVELQLLKKSQTTAFNKRIQEHITKQQLKAFEQHRGKGKVKVKVKGKGNPNPNPNPKRGKGKGKKGELNLGGGY